MLHADSVGPGMTKGFEASRVVVNEGTSLRWPSLGPRWDVTVLLCKIWLEWRPFNSLLFPCTGRSIKAETTQLRNMPSHSLHGTYPGKKEGGGLLEPQT